MKMAFCGSRMDFLRILGERSPPTLIRGDTPSALPGAGYMTCQATPFYGSLAVSFPMGWVTFVPGGH
jgi:hypothetical protein